MELKKRFLTAPILEHFYSDRETVVETDTSDRALRCVLSQFKDKRLHPASAKIILCARGGPCVWGT